MSMREMIARALCAHVGDDWEREGGEPLTGYLDMADAVLAVLREPTPEMMRIAVTQTDLTDAHFDKAASVLEGMPPLSPARQQEGLRAVADMYRDWQAMIDAASKKEG